MLRTICVGLMGASLASEALAQEAPPRWAISASLSGAQLEDEEDPRLGAGVLSIERQFESGRVGVLFGGSQGETFVPELQSDADESSFFGALWWGAAAGAYDLVFNLGYGEQTLEGVRIASSEAPPALSGLEVAIDGEVKSLNTSFSISRAFGEAVLITPSFTLSYDETETELIAESAGGAAFTANESASGFSGALGLDVEAPLSERFSLMGGLAFLATEEAAAQGVWSTRATGAQPINRQEEGGATEWGEAYLGLAIAPSERATLAATIGSTIGREQEEAFASVTLAFVL